MDHDLIIIFFLHLPTQSLSTWLMSTWEEPQQSTNRKRQPHFYPYGKECFGKNSLYNRPSIKAILLANESQILKAEILLTFPQVGRPPDQFGHQHLYWWRFCTQGLLFALQPGKAENDRFQQKFPSPQNKNRNLQTIQAAIYFR